MKRYDLSTHAAEQSLLVSAALGDFIRYADHAAFVAQVREVAEGMECARDCESTLKAWETNLARCTCPRGKLLALCEVK